jgi:hypothetical protein
MGRIVSLGTLLRANRVVNLRSFSSASKPFDRNWILRLLAPVFTETGFYLALFGMPMVFLLRLMFAITTTGTLLA